ncbi:MAG: pyruvate kinase [Candidatus Thermoplasmatota archaeon]|nr:pyruvate kinase [Candidatus Thermoplasmatota archaeon]MBS3789581.1 pyruvate kinase [Candidatus Thermoplasmatota archaeon]
MRKTKIVATIGPASDSKEELERLVAAGIDVARQNFSHGTHDEHYETLTKIRDISDQIGVMMDTQGPEIRLNEIEEDTELHQGEKLKIVTQDVKGNEEILPVDHPEIEDYLKEGDTILIDDGQIELNVLEVGDEVKCEVIYGGKILSRKSVNVPGKDMGLRVPTEKDIQDIKFSVDKDFDFISASFVKSAGDIEKIRELLKKKNSDMNIIAKIEHIKAVENIDEIIHASDGVMIARGDLGVEIPASDIPVLQKQIIEKANIDEKPVITATQMLKSMTESPRATRAEVSDVANAVFDGSSAVMLSEETAIGKYPVKSVEFMSEVLEKMEQYVKERKYFTTEKESNDIADIIAKNVSQAAREIDVKYIVAHTSSGYTAHKISRFRPNVDIIAFTDKKSVQRRLSLIWGVKAFYSEFPDHVDDMVCGTARELFDRGMVEKDDKLLITAGVPAPVTGITNTMQIRTVKSLLEEGCDETMIDDKV